MAQQASLHESANSLAALQSNRKVMALTPASSAGATTTSATGAADSDVGRGSAEDDAYATEDDELTPDLTIAVSPSGNKSSPFYELITYVFQKVSKGMTATLPTTAPSGISALHSEMYLAALEELRRQGPVFHKKDVLVILSAIINTVVPSGRRFSISKHVKAASLLPKLDPNSDIYLSVTGLLRDLLVALHPQIDHDRHCPPQFGQLKKCVWLCSTPEKTAVYRILQIMNQIILWIELGLFETPTSEQVYVSAWSLLFNILLSDSGIRAIPGDLVSKASANARQQTEDAFGSTTSASRGRKVDLSIRIRVDNQWKTEIAIFEFKSSSSTPEMCKKQQQKSVRINAAILLDLASRGLHIDKSYPIIAEGRALGMDFYTLRRYQDVLGAGRSTPKGVSLPSQVDDLKSFLESDTMITLLAFRESDTEHLRRFAVDVKDVLGMSTQTPFGSSSDEDTDEDDVDGTLSVDVPARPSTPPPKKRPNPHILFSPSKRDKRPAQDLVDFVDDDEDDG
ncbi:hypothetical protein BGZ96_006066 [Linnemannia gamsii]|uniref:Uncharacterized protein n=1 Tax=Linnemannia gamsii TaxID=64522 RepID=A0ABQ7K3P5_9FUNG|nr:hypothetical protein BGZ96_006066 [Linnemannia gamsii]